MSNNPSDGGRPASGAAADSLAAASALPPPAPSRTALCFGDSLTWGFDPATGARLPFQDRWTTSMAARLGPAWQVLVEALPGRTTTFDTPFAPLRNGAAIFPALLESHAPVDVVIIMLGTNDLQVALGLSARQAALGVWALLDQARRSLVGPGGVSPAAIVVSPPHLHEPKGYMGMIWEGREAESEKLAPALRLVAERAGASFLDAADSVTPSDVDGVHLDASAQQRLGQALAPQVVAAVQDRLG